MTISKINSRFFIKLGTYLIGLFILAMGVAFSINSGLGVSPVNSLPYVLSLIVNIPIRYFIIIIFTIYVLLQWLILKKDFRLYSLFQIAFSVLFGYFVDFALQILGSFTIPTYIGQLVMLLISMILIALGITIYVSAALIPLPMEGLVSAITKVSKNRSFGTNKIIVDVIVVSTGILLSYLFLKSIVGIREGTVLSALLIGLFVKQFQKWFHKKG